MRPEVPLKEVDMMLLDPFVGLIDDDALEKSLLKEVDEFLGIPWEIFLFCDAAERAFELSNVADIFFSENIF